LNFYYNRWGGGGGGGGGRFETDPCLLVINSHVPALALAGKFATRGGGNKRKEIQILLFLLSSREQDIDFILK